MFQPCRAPRRNHNFVLIPNAKLGCEWRSRKHRFKIHFGGSNGDLAAPRVISGSHFGSLLETRSWKKGAWNVRLHPWGLKVALRQRQIGPRAHIYIEMAFIFLIAFGYFVCILCCDLSLASQLNLFCWVCFPFISLYSGALQSRAQHSKAEQRTAMAPAKGCGPATHTAQLRVLEENTHVA